MDARPHDAGESDEAPATDPAELRDDTTAVPHDAAADGAPDGGTQRSSDPSGDPEPDGTEEAVAASPAEVGPHPGEDDHADPRADLRPEADEDDLDAQWRDLVARLEGMGAGGPPTGAAPAPGAAAVRRGPAPDGRGRVVRDVDGTDDAPPPIPAASPAPTPRSWSPDPVLAEAEDHFEPPDPGPVLAGDPLLTLAWTAVIGVPVLLLLVAVIWRDAPSLVLQVAAAIFLSGLGLLLWRMPHGDDQPRGPGAVV